MSTFAWSHHSLSLNFENVHIDVPILSEEMKLSSVVCPHIFWKSLVAVWITSLLMSPPGFCICQLVTLNFGQKEQVTEIFSAIASPLYSKVLLYLLHSLFAIMFLFFSCMLDEIIKCCLDFLIFSILCQFYG